MWHNNINCFLEVQKTLENEKLLAFFFLDFFFSQVLFLCTCYLLNPFRNKPWFLHVYITSLLKTVWETKKLMLVKISPFPAVFSTRLGNFVQFLSNFKLSSANFFSLEQFKICHLGKG